MPQLVPPDMFMLEKMSYQEIFALKVKVMELRTIFKTLGMFDQNFGGQFGLNWYQLETDFSKLEYFIDAAIGRKQQGGYA